MIAPALRKVSRNQWALIAAVTVLVAMILLALAADLHWTWPAIAIFAVTAVRVFLNVSKSDNQAARNLGRSLRVKRDARERESSEPQ